jgi:hypothetical protein
MLNLDTLTSISGFSVFNLVNLTARNIKFEELGILLIEKEVVHARSFKRYNEFTGRLIEFNLGRAANRDLLLHVRLGDNSGSVQTDTSFIKNSTADFD